MKIEAKMAMCRCMVNPTKRVPLLNLLANRTTRAHNLDLHHNTIQARVKDSMQGAVNLAIIRMLGSADKIKRVMKKASYQPA